MNKRSCRFAAASLFAIIIKKRKGEEYAKKESFKTAFGSFIGNTAGYLRTGIVIGGTDGRGRGRK